MGESSAGGYFVAGSNLRQWRRPSDEQSPHPPSEPHPRRPARPASSVPPLVHADTTHSSVSDIVTPGIPYQNSLLPPLDAPKGDRTLPPPVPSSYSIITSPLDVRPILPHPANYVTQHQNQNLEEGSQWPALLRATAMARDADLQDDDNSKRDRGPE
jgi:hypothetical protein